MCSCAAPIEPQAGKLALPGGYIDYGEIWQVAVLHEVKKNRRKY